MNKENFGFARIRQLEYTCIDKSLQYITIEVKLLNGTTSIVTVMYASIDAGRGGSLGIIWFEPHVMLSSYGLLWVISTPF